MREIKEYLQRQEGEFYHFCFPKNKKIVVQYRGDDLKVVYDVAKKRHAALLRKKTN